MVMNRITANPDILGGKPVIRGTRLSVEFILDLLASNVSEEEILEDYQHLTKKIFMLALDMRRVPALMRFISNLSLPPHETPSNQTVGR